MNNSIVFQPISTNEHDPETSFTAILTMTQYTPKERAEIVAFYIENNRSIVKTVRAYRQKYGRNSAPSDNTIRSLVKNLSNGGGHLIDVVFLN